MGFNLEKTVLIFRCLQLPAALIFLIAICWAESTAHIGASHPVTTALRFLAGLLSVPYTSYDALIHFKKVDLRQKSGAFKSLRLLAELILTALWYLSLIMGAAEKNTTLGNTNPAINTPAILATASWVAEIVLFSLSVLVVAIQTFRRWSAHDPKAVFEGGYEG